MHYFIKQILDYKSQLKKYDLTLDFAVTLNTEGHLLAWPLPALSPSTANGAGIPLPRVPKAYSFKRLLVWEGQKIGYYYWTGNLDSHQQAVNELLIDNLVTKIVLHTQIDQNLSCGMGVLDSAVQAIEAKDQYTRGHSDRVAQIALRLAARIEPELTQQDVEVASKLHDIGKIGVSELVLTKPSGLTLDEMELIRKHPDIGANILQPLPIFTHLVPAIRHHHEKYDGTGYPARLAGSEIPLLSRIIAIADTYDALTSNRPYRGALPQQQALKIIANARSSQLDPGIVDTFLTLHQDLLHRKTS